MVSDGCMGWLPKTSSRGPATPGSPPGPTGSPRPVGADGSWSGGDDVIADVSVRDEDDASPLRPMVVGSDGTSADTGHPAAPTEQGSAPERRRRAHLRGVPGYSALQRLLAASVTVAFLVMLVAGQHFSPANSDTVAQQNILRSVLDGQPSDLVVPENTWWLHLPIYLLTSLLPNSAAAHLLDVLLTNAILLVGLLVFVQTYVRRAFPGSRLALTVAHLLAGWFLGLAVYTPLLAATAGPFNNVVASQTFLTPNHRNLETGVALLLLAWFARWDTSTRSPSRARRTALWLAAAVLLGALFRSDPFFLYSLGGALAVTSVVFWLNGRWGAGRTAAVSALLLGAGVVLTVLSAGMRAVGLHAVPMVGTSFVPLEGLGGNLRNVLGGYLAMFRSYFWGLDVGASIGLVLLNAVLAAAVVAGVVTVLAGQSRNPDPVRLPALVSVVIALVAFAASTLATEPTAFRYVFVPVLIAVTFATDAVMAVARRTSRWRSAVVVMLGVAFIANLAVNTSVVVRKGVVAADSMYAANRDVIEAVEDAGYRKGYASFWNANINTYLSGREVLFLPIHNDRGVLIRHNFLINTPDFDMPVDETFVYVAPADVFSVEDVVVELGAPVATEELPDGGTLLFYSRDVGAGMRSLLTEALE